ncbi:MAG: DUF3043 domain-containing protein [Streptosporangiales bacterium]|nr:DUF3043 domain-containing protein [Streptosporangiales bacterium]
MFRRRTETAPENGPVEVDDLRKGQTAPKGRPTPKRSEVERGQRRPISAPADRKQAYRQFKDRQKADRARAREGMMRGDEKYLPARDRGPVRALARDYVDSRRTLGEFFLWLSLAIVLLAMLPVAPVQAGAYFVVWPAMMVGIIGEGFWTSRRVKALAQERYPGESHRGIGMYAAMRALQMRRLRLPPPRVKRGERI